MFPVQMKTQVQGKTYRTVLQYIDSSGKEHKRELTGTAEEGDSRLRLEVKAVLAGMERMARPSEITIKTCCGYIKTGFDYMDTWKENNWLKAGGKQVANRDLWVKLEEKSRGHRINVYIV